MAFDDKLANRVRESIAHLSCVEEKKMMGGLNFMVNGKMCIGILGDELMCRIDPSVYESALERNGCREMDFTGKPMKGFVFVGPSGYAKKADFNFWILKALEFNERAKASKKKSR